MRDFDDIRDKIMGSIENPVRSAYNKGYDAGYEDGTKEKPSLIYEQYEQGLNDGWECVKKFHLWSNEKLEQMFGCTVWDIFHHKSAKEVMAVFEKYDKEFKVGDEVICECPTRQRCIVIAVHEDNTAIDISIMRSDGMCYGRSKEGVVKTGRSFPEIVDAMKRLKEGDSQ